MTEPSAVRRVDPVPAAALFAAVAGLLSLRYPYFDGLTAALAALLVVAWGTSRPRSRGRWSGPLPPVAAALTAAGVGWIVFFTAPVALAEMRGLILGAAGLPLWFGFDRAGPRPPEGEGT